MTMRIYGWPAEWNELVTECRFFLQPVTLASAGLFGGRRGAHGPVSHLWACELSLGPTDSPIWRRVSAFFSRLDGRVGMIRLPDPDRLAPLGTGLGAVTSPGDAWSDGTHFSDGMGWSTTGSFVTVGADAARGAGDLMIGGLVASQPVALAGGDLMQIGRYLYEVADDAVSDASGFARVEIRPRLRAPVIAGDMVQMRAAAGLFSLSGDDQGAVERMASTVRPWGHVRGSLGVTLIEALPE